MLSWSLMHVLNISLHLDPIFWISQLVYPCILYPIIHLHHQCGRSGYQCRKLRYLSSLGITTVWHSTLWTYSYACPSRCLNFLPPNTLKVACLGLLSMFKCVWLIVQEPSPSIAAYLHWLHGGCMHFGSCSFGLKGSACTRPPSYALQMKPVVEGGEGFYRSFGLNTVKTSHPSPYIAESVCLAVPFDSRGCIHRLSRGIQKPPTWDCWLTRPSPLQTGSYHTRTIILGRQPPLTSFSGPTDAPSQTLSACAGVCMQ